MVLRRFYKYLKVFEKKESEKIPTKKLQNYAINLRERFILKKGRIYLLSRIEKEEVQEFLKDQLRKKYIQPSKSPQMLLVFFMLKKNEKEENSIDLLIFEQLDDQD